MTENANDNAPPARLPRGVTRHGNGFRCRVTDKVTKERLWLPAEPTPEAAERTRDQFNATGRLPATACTPQQQAAGERAVEHLPSFKSFIENEWFPEYRTRGNLFTTMRLWRTRYDKHLASLRWLALPLDQITREMVVAWLHEAVQPFHTSGGSQGISPATATDMLWLLRSAYDVAKAGRFAAHLQGDPFHKVKPPQPLNNGNRSPADRRVQVRHDAPSLLTVEQVVELARHLPQVDVGPLYTGYFTALRVGESLGLRIKDFDAERATLTIEQQYGLWLDESTPNEHGQPTPRYLKPWTKSQASHRLLYLAPSLSAYLARYVAHFHGPTPDPEALLFTPPALGLGLAFRYDGFSQRLKKSAKVTGLQVCVDAMEEGGSPATSLVATHDLRKAISSLLADSASGPARSAYLGHEHPSTWDESDVTAKYYTFPMEGAMREIAIIIERFITNAGCDLWEASVPQDLVDVNQAADLLGCHFNTVWTYVKEGHLRQQFDKEVIGVGRPAFKFLREEVLAYREVLQPPGTISLAEAGSELRVAPQQVGKMVRTGVLGGSKNPRGQYYVYEHAMEAHRQFLADRKARRLLTTGEAAKATGLTVGQVHARIRNGTLPHREVRGDFYIHVDDLTVPVLPVSLPEDAVTVRDLADELGLSEPKIRRYLREGDWPGVVVQSRGAVWAGPEAAAALRALAGAPEDCTRLITLVEQWSVKRYLIVSTAGSAAIVRTPLGKDLWLRDEDVARVALALGQPWPLQASAAA